MLWFGKELPENFEYVKNAYQLANPDFNIKVYHELDIKHSSNPDIKECREMIMRGNNKYSMIFDAPHFKGNQYTDDVVFNTCFSDTFRCFLIDKYGGIYVDCDTFPAKSFDEKLLSHKKFHCTVKWSIAVYPQLDIFFIGGEPKCDCYPGWVYKADNKIKRPFALPIDDVQQNSLMRRKLRPKYDN